MTAHVRVVGDAGRSVGDNRAGMPVGLLDIGSNTVRLYVAIIRNGRVEPLYQERAQLLLGEEIARRGFLSEPKLVETGKVARKYAHRARELGCSRLSVLVTAPGRGAANAGALVSVLSAATGAPVQVLAPEEEGTLAFDGAAAAAGIQAGRVAVCDLGGGSTEIVVGEPDARSLWVRSLPVGSLSLAVRFLDGGSAGKRAIAAAREEVEQVFAGVEPPAPELALATGGSARGIGKIVGGRILGEDELAAALRVLSKRSPREVSKAYGLDRQRVRTLAAGAIVLGAVQRRLGMPLEISRAGLREGAALSLFEQRAAA